MLHKDNIQVKPEMQLVSLPSLQQLHALYQVQSHRAYYKLMSTTRDYSYCHNQPVGGCLARQSSLRNFPKLRNEGRHARGRAFVISIMEMDPTVVTDISPVNGLYASILFDSGAERSFITPKFRELLIHKFRNLDEPYIVEMANKESGSTQEMLQTCLLTLNNHTFHVNPMPMIIGSFDVVIGMDWLSPHRDEILCYGKAV
uniref:Reverse transcriptase domain-containing protein n=1 Tax=Lactuca sativa TaxID=4236 RepID=A0A9R1XAE3_LACSA|nr:hypothetical protein LSAT_V11C600322330 [Lactuca sativa]